MGEADPPTARRATSRGPSAQAAEVGLLVVYGSLMRGLGRGPQAEDADREDPRDLLDRLGVGPGLRRIGPCRVAGRLFDLGPYPALRPARAAGEQVRGELHAILDPGVLAVLDDFERYDPRRPEQSDYLRQPIALIEPSGASAWIYVHRLEPEARRLVPSGDWRAHLAERVASGHVSDSPGATEPVSLAERLARTSRGS